jgi:hypothetical protein
LRRHRHGSRPDHRPPVPPSPSMCHRRPPRGCQPIRELASGQRPTTKRIQKSRPQWLVNREASATLSTGARNAKRRHGSIPLRLSPMFAAKTETAKPFSCKVVPDERHYSSCHPVCPLRRPHFVAVMTDDCFTCGARARHQRLVERRCAGITCETIFTVKSDRNSKRYCCRDCQLESYTNQRKEVPS